MVDQTAKFRAYDPEPDQYDEDPINSRPTLYKFGRSARTSSAFDHSVPLFLSDPDGEPDPQEFITPLRRGRFASFSSRILMAVLVASAAAMLFAGFSSDAMRGVIANAKASIAAIVPAPSAAAQPDSASLTPGDLQLKDPASADAQLRQQASQQDTKQDTQQAAAAAPAVAQMDASAPTPAPAPAPVVVASASPTHEQISNAYQSALQGQVPRVQAATAPTAVPPAQQVRKIDPDELASLIENAKHLLRIGNIPTARLLLKRAAAARDPTAALMLARTYDAKVLDRENLPNFKPQPAEARAWYKKAAAFGSAEAQRALAQLPD
ncbi:MAG: hypothetical protein ACRECL_03815 [Bradyrhizobium sp.]